MTLKLIKYHPLFAYSVGDEFQVSESDEKLLIDGGYAIPTKAIIETPESHLEEKENASIEISKNKKVKKS